MSYRNLEVWQLARNLTTEIHFMTTDLLPKYEMYEVGSQIRRSIKSVRSNLVEGYGRRRYKREFMRFLTYSLSSCDETRDHLEVLRETRCLVDDRVYERLAQNLDELGKKINKLITSVEQGHRSVRESASVYAVDNGDDGCQWDDHPASSIQHPASGSESSDP